MIVVVMNVTMIYGRLYILFAISAWVTAPESYKDCYCLIHVIGKVRNGKALPLRLPRSQRNRITMQVYTVYSGL
jgi:hypothetical protein